MAFFITKKKKKKKKKKGAFPFFVEKVGCKQLPPGQQLVEKEIRSRLTQT
jgi:hypothetical protein